VEGWKAYLDTQKADWNTIDISTTVDYIMAAKDDAEIEVAKTAATITDAMMNYMQQQIVTILERGTSITHEALAERAESVLLGENAKKVLKLPPHVDMEVVDWCYTPIVQSGGKYDLRSSAASNADKLHSGTIVCSLGARYKNYCSNVARTFLIDPTKEQDQNYMVLQNLQEKLLKEVIHNGVECQDVYTKCVTYLRNTAPELETHLLKNCGFGMGIEFRESAYTLNGKNNRRLQKGMVINLILGLQNMTNSKTADPLNRTYAYMISDTVLVQENDAVLLTKADKSRDDVIYAFTDENQGQEEIKPTRRSAPDSVKVAGKKKSTVLNAKFRSEIDDDARNLKRFEHQRALFERRQAEGRDRYENNAEANEGTISKQFKKFQSYLREDQLPLQTQDNQIIVDRRNYTVILPIYGLAVPFHLNTLKNVTKIDEGDHLALRFNFVSPGQPGARKDELIFDDPSATFVRSLTYRSADVGRLASIQKEITELKKAIAKTEAEVKERADIVTQAELVPVSGRLPLRLPNVYARPTVDGKRSAGQLEIHKNGIRYKSLSGKLGSNIDILFSNVKHFYFQPCDQELIVLLHVHLIHPILIGKKKAKDVQFYREASEAQFDETGNRKRRYHYGDEDELEAEQEERRRRAQLNREFKTFAEKISEESEPKVQVDVPFRELGFQGVPFRSVVLLQPTTDCLVHLADPPFLVITLADIELVHLERIQFGLKNFDMVFVFKEFTKTPIHINSVPMTQLDDVREWLDSVDLVFTEGPMNLNWSTIMKTINDDPKAFFEEGGWSFLKIESDNESDAEDSASEFEMSAESEEYSGSSSDYESDATESESADSSVDSGEDWDELEAKAKRHDEGRDEGKKPVVQPKNKKPRY
jgi:nucleosome binding factor SPN SPT16 subunit